MDFLFYKCSNGSSSRCLCPVGEDYALQPQECCMAWEGSLCPFQWPRLRLALLVRRRYHTSAIHVYFGYKSSNCFSCEVITSASRMQIKKRKNNLCGMFTWNKALTIDLCSLSCCSMLHLTGYDVTMDDLKQFRQLDSYTPGHPENVLTKVIISVILFCSNSSSSNRIFI